jgi:hypothetical protein
MPEGSEPASSSALLSAMCSPKGANYRLDVRESGITGLATIHEAEVSQDIARLQRGGIALLPEVMLLRMVGWTSPSRPTFAV